LIDFDYSMRLGESTDQNDEDHREADDEDNREADDEDNREADDKDNKEADDNASREADDNDRGEENHFEGHRTVRYITLIVNNRLTDISPMQGTSPFMSLQVLKYNPVQRPSHDLESIFYVLLYICSKYEGPGKVKSTPIVDNWFKTLDYNALALCKADELTDITSFTRDFHPYFADLVECVEKMWDIIFPSDIGIKAGRVYRDMYQCLVTHNDLLEVLKEKYEELPDLDPDAPSNPSLLPKRQSSKKAPSSSGQPPSSRRSSASSLRRKRQAEDSPSQGPDSGFDSGRGDRGGSSNVVQVKRVRSGPKKGKY
jgi:hypothetical protein